MLKMNDKQISPAYSGSGGSKGTPLLDSSSLSIKGSDYYKTHHPPP
jgi:hypothetical protein